MKPSGRQGFAWVVSTVVRDFSCLGEAGLAPFFAALLTRSIHERLIFSPDCVQCSMHGAYVEAHDRHVLVELET